MGFITNEGVFYPSQGIGTAYIVSAFVAAFAVALIINYFMEKEK